MLLRAGLERLLLDPGLKSPIHCAGLYRSESPPARALRGPAEALFGSLKFVGVEGFQTMAIYRKPA